VIGRKDLNPWADLRLVANRNLHDIEHDAAKIQEHARTETDVEGQGIGSMAIGPDFRFPIVNERVSRDRL
jgi:hypothetical protein